MMKHKDLLDLATFACILKAYVNVGALEWDEDLDEAFEELAM